MAEDLHYSSRSDNKRKFDSQVGPTSPAAPTSGRRPSGFSAPIFSTPTSAAAPPCYKSVAPPLDGIELAKQRAQEIAARLFSDAEAKRPRVENGGGADDSSNKGYSFDQPQNPFGQPLSSQAGMTAPSFAPYGYPGSSKKIDVPNGRVGVIIGKSGETIKYLQVQSGARIQVTRDMDADPNSQSRPVELIGTPEQISKAEQLISDVLAEAEAGGSGIVSRKFSSPPTAADHFSMKVPNNKVGLIIGKGGETIKNMQASSGARIQVIPLHLPPGDMSNERTVHIDGTTEQIESAKQLVNEVISENRPRISQSGGFRPPRPQTGWDQSMQQPGYGYMQPGAYSVQPPQYNMPQPLYGWDQSANPSNQQTTQVTGYDYYNQQQLPQQQQNVAASSAPADTNSYSYSQIPTPYSAPGSYTDPSYSQSITGQQQGYAQSGSYVQPAPQAGYAQPTYGSVSAYSNSTASAQDGSSAPAATQQAPPSTAQQAYTQQGNTGYANQSGYPQSPQGQKPPPAQPAYGQTQQTVSSQAAYAQLAQAYAQTSQVYSQPGYAPVSSHAPGAYGQSYAQQQQQPYNDSYAGAYGQPSYSSDATHVAYEAAQNAPGGAAKASPQS